MILDFPFWILDCGKKQMQKKMRIPLSDVLEIQNLKRLGLSVITFLLSVTGAAAKAQQTANVPRIGYLSGSSLSALASRIEAFRQGLRDLGYVEGKNIVIEWREPVETLIAFASSRPN
jgi:hypothetical protein